MLQTLTNAERGIVDKTIEITRENKRLHEEIERLKGQVVKLTEERSAVKHLMDAAITAFFRTGAPAPNITPEDWQAGSTYQIIHNGSFDTIARSVAESKREAAHEANNAPLPDGARWAKARPRIRGLIVFD